MGIQMTAGEGHKTKLGEPCMNEQGVLFDPRNEMMSYTQTSQILPKSPFKYPFQKMYIFYKPYQKNILKTWLMLPLVASW
jgi:hypothetical protein